jgi:hypothetical protein
MGRSFRRRSAVLCSNLVVLGCLSCSTEGGSETSHQGTADRIDPIPLTDLFSGVHYRYEELEHPTDLAALSLVQLVVAGEVSGFEAGPSFTPREPGDTLMNVVMHVSVSRTAKGPEPADGRVRVLLTGGSHSIEEVEAALPSGSEVVLYLTPPVDLPESASVDLWLPASPQGFLVGDSDGTGVIQPLAHKEMPNALLERQFPAG